MAKKKSSRIVPFHPFHLITIGRPSLLLSDVSIPGRTDLGYGDVYEFRYSNGASAGAGFNVPHRRDWIVWCCAQPFTFLATDTSQWGHVAGWKTLVLWDGNQYTAFAAINSTSSPLPVGLHAILPNGFSNHLVLQALGNNNGLCEYIITIPQVDLVHQPKYVAKANPPGNPLVRATIILQ